MKILQLTTHINMGGVARYVSTLSHHLQKRGHDVVVASSGGDLRGYLVEKGIRHIDVDLKTKSELSPKLIKTVLMMRPFLKKERFDVIHAHTRVAQVVSLILSRAEGIPFVSTCHGFFKKRLGRRLLPSWGKRVVAISEAVRDDLISKFKVDKEKIDLIYTGIELDKFVGGITEKKRIALKERWRLRDSTVIGTIGRLSSVKGQDTLLRAFKKLPRDLLNKKLVLVGGGPEEERLKRLTHRLGLTDNVMFAPSVNDTIDALAIMDIFVLPSIEEGLGLSLVEAMAAGVPCVASKIGGIENLIEDGVSGLLVDPGDDDGLANAINFVLKHGEAVENFKEKAKKRIIENFNIDDMVSRIEETYGKSLQSGD